MSSTQQQSQQQQPQGPPPNKTPIAAGEAAKAATAIVRDQIFASIHERSGQNMSFVSIAAALQEDLVTEFQELGYRVLRGKYATLIEWN